MERRHLRRQNRISTPHLFGKTRPMFGNEGTRHCQQLTYPVFILLADSSQQRTDPDTGSAQIIDLIDLDQCIELIALFENLLHLDVYKRQGEH